MRIIKPQKLLLGDTVGIIAPASPPKDAKRIDLAVEVLCDLGFKVKLGKSIRKRAGYLAGSDGDRLNDLHSMFKDRSVKAIIALRGGYGSTRLLEGIDFDLVKRNPKIFSGFSDITALQLAFLAQAGLLSFNGPNALSGFSPESVDTSLTIASFLRLVLSDAKGAELGEGFNLRAVKTIHPGRSEGHLIGGNLSLLCSLVGTPYLPKFNGAILFLEDVAEHFYRIDRMISHLKNASVFDGVRGIVLGHWAECGGKRAPESQTYRFFKDLFGWFKGPIIYSYPFGHIDNFCTMPQGLRVRLDGGQRTVKLLESAVSS